MITTTVHLNSDQRWGEHDVHVMLLSWMMTATATSTTTSASA